MSRKVSFSLPEQNQSTRSASPCSPTTLKKNHTGSNQSDTVISVIPSLQSPNRHQSSATRSILGSRQGSLKPSSPKGAVPLYLPALPKGASVARNVLVLGLEGTLAHYSLNPRDRYTAHITKNCEVNGVNSDVYTRHRPFVMSFLDIMSRAFECVLFTASLPEYADAVMDGLDPRRKLVPHRLYREHCTVAGTDSKGSSIRVKDLTLLGRDLRRVVILDNSPASFMLQPRNGIQIASWYDDPDDRALLELIPLLLELSKVSDVTQALQQHYSQNMP